MKILRKVITFGIMALVIAWAVLMWPASFGGPTSFVVVAGDSMEPTYSNGDLVIAREQDTYHIGDVIAFNVDKHIIIHRIIGGSADEGFITKGDNNERPDNFWHPTSAEIMGRTWLHIPSAGTILFFYKTHPVYLGLMASGLMGLALLSELKPAKGKQVLGNTSKDVRCPKCGSEAVIRTSKKGPNTGRKFYVCTHYPECIGTIAVE
jgi:signal peptidase